MTKTAIACPEPPRRPIIFLQPRTGNFSTAKVIMNGLAPLDTANTYAVTTSWTVSPN